MTVLIYACGLIGIALKAPEASTTEGKAVMAEITAKIEGFAKWIETQASSL